MSQWIFFEAGYVYSRKVKVVPVAIGGADIAKTAAPISLLQGFNLNNHSGLNNIVSIINTKFGHTHQLAFTQADYEKIFRPEKNAGVVQVSYYGWVEAILIRTKVPFPEVRPSIEAACRGRGLDVQVSDFELLTYGARYARPTEQVEGAGQRNEWLQVAIAPEATELHYSLLREVLSNEQQKTLELRTTYYLNERVGCVRPNNRLTAKLRGSEIRLGPRYNCQFRGSLFWLEYGHQFSYDDLPSDGVRIEVELSPLDLLGFDIAELLRILFQLRVLFVR